MHIYPVGHVLIGAAFRIHQPDNIREQVGIRHQLLSYHIRPKIQVQIDNAIGLSRGIQHLHTLYLPFFQRNMLRLRVDILNLQ